jgi:rubrerythrin
MKKKDVTSKSILKDRICAVCGNKFDVKLEDNNSIPIQYFYSKELGKALTGSKTEYWECEYCSGYFNERVKEWMIKNWGNRCPDYEESCPLCKAWKYFDYIFEID